MASERQLYLGRFQVNSDMVAFGVNSTTHEINTGYYFTAAYSGEADGTGTRGGEQLCEQFQNVIRDDIADVEVNVTLNGATQRVAITANVDMNITFDDPALGDAMGFSTAALSLAATHTAPDQPRYTWAPSRGLSTRPVDLNIFWDEHSTSKVTRSKDGTTYSIQGNRLFEGTYGYRVLDRSEVIQDSASFYESLQQYWQDIVHKGQRMRVLFDRNTYESNTYAEGLMVPAGAMSDDTLDVGTFTTYMGRRLTDYDGLWDVDFSLVKHVG